MSPYRAALAAIFPALIAVAPASGPSAQAAASATPWTEIHASRVRLTADRAKAPSGASLAGLEISLADGWKTYWRMPGDSGVPPTFDWTGSTNLAAAKVLYPAPMRMPEAGGTAIGYKHAVLLPIEVSPIDPAKAVGLKLALEFGICREICIPATVNFNLSIPPAASGSPAAPIAAAIERVPRTHQGRRKDDPVLKRVSVTLDEASPKLVIEATFSGDAKGADVFVEAPEGLYVPVPNRVAADAGAGGAARFEADLGGDLAKDLKGKTLVLTLVSDAGASEAQWVFP